MKAQIVPVALTCLVFGWTELKAGGEPVAKTSREIQLYCENAHEIYSFWDRPQGYRVLALALRWRDKATRTNMAFYLPVTGIRDPAEDPDRNSLIATVSLDDGCDSRLFSEFDLRQDLEVIGFSTSWPKQTHPMSYNPETHGQVFPRRPDRVAECRHEPRGKKHHHHHEDRHNPTGR